MVVEGSRYTASPLRPRLANNSQETKAMSLTVDGSTEPWHLASLLASHTLYVRSTPTAVPYSHHRKVSPGLLFRLALPNHTLQVLESIVQRCPRPLGAVSRAIEAGQVQALRLTAAFVPLTRRDYLGPELCH